MSADDRKTIVIEGPGFAPCPKHAVFTAAGPNVFRERFLTAQTCASCTTWGELP